MSSKSKALWGIEVNYGAGWYHMAVDTDDEGTHYAFYKHKDAAVNAASLLAKRENITCTHCNNPAYGEETVQTRVVKYARAK